MPEEVVLGVFEFHNALRNWKVRYPGVLLKAKRQGVVQGVDILLPETRRNGFYIDSRLETLVLEQAGELPKDQ